MRYMLLVSAMMLCLVTVSTLSAAEPAVRGRIVAAAPYSIDVLQSRGDEALRRARRQGVVSVLHNTFGYTALGFALASGFLNPELVPAVPTSLHASFGYTASGFAIGALATGALVHSNALSPDTAEGSTDFVHAVLGIAGGLLIAVTPYIAPGDAHETLGIAGTTTMGISVLLQLVGD